MKQLLPYVAPLQTYDVRDFGATGDGSTDDTDAIQDALTTGAGKTVLFPATGDAYLIDAPLVVADSTTIRLESATIIEQQTKYKPIFDINLVDDVTIDGQGALLRYLGSRTWAAGTTTRADGEAVYGSGVWSSGNRTAVRHLNVYGFTAGVHFSGWNGTALTAYSKQGNSAADIQIDMVDFGLLFTGQDGLKASGIRGKSVLAPPSPNPAHLIYCSFGARNRQITISDCEAWDNDGFPYQFKGCDGGTIKNLSARNSVGLLSIGGPAGAYNSDVSFANIVGRDIQTTAGSGAVFYQNSDLRVRIDGLALHMAVSDRAIRLDGTDCVLSNVKIRSRHDVQADTPDILILGTRCGVDGVSIVNIQDDGTDYTTAWRGVTLSTGTDCFVRPLALTNMRIGIETAAGATRPRIDLSQAAIGLASSSGQMQVFDASTTSNVIPQARRISADNGDAAKTLTVGVSEQVQLWDSPLTVARAVTLSTTGAYNGARFRIVRSAASTGAFNLNVGTGPLKALAVGQWCEVEYASAWVLTQFGSL